MKVPCPKTQEEAKLDSYNGSKFEFNKLMKEFEDNDKVSIVSGIVNEDRPGTPFISTVIPFHEDQ